MVFILLSLNTIKLLEKNIGKTLSDIPSPLQPPENHKTFGDYPIIIRQQKKMWRKRCS